MAALANLAVSDSNEIEIAKLGGLEAIIAGAKSVNPDLQAQCARALRNLSVSPQNKLLIQGLGGVDVLRVLAKSSVQKINTQLGR